MGTIHKNSFFMITKKKFQINNLSEILNKVKIGTDFKLSVTDIVLNKLFKFNDLKKNIDYKLNYFNNNINILDKLVNDKIKIGVITNQFPDINLSKIFNDNIEDPLTFIPLDNFNLDLFIKKEPLIEVKNIDLNKVSDTFLPNLY